MKTPFIGLGTGRCGTTSLMKVVSACKNTAVGQETKEFITKWYEPKLEKIDSLLTHLKVQTTEGILAGEISPPLLPRIAYVRRIMPDIKVLCIHREKAEVVNSYMRFAQGRSLVKPGSKGKKVKSGGWYGWTPIMDAYDVKQSWEFYWEMYYRWCNNLENVYHLDVEDLNNRKETAQLFDFLEIPELDRVYLEDTHYNTWEQVKKIRGHE